MNVMVGDSYSNESVQFRKVLAVSEVQVALTDPGNALKMLKIETVDLSGFYSAAINKDPDAVFVGQSLTAVGYNQAVQGMAPWYDGYTDEQRGRYLEGEVYESPLIVSEVGHTSFKAKQLVMIGPCSGKCLCRWLRIRQYHSVVAANTAFIGASGFRAREGACL